MILDYFFHLVFCDVYHALTECDAKINSDAHRKYSSVYSNLINKRVAHIMPI